MFKTSIENDRLSVIYTPKNYKVTRNVPLDCRFIVSSLDNLDKELPEYYRYNGLVFFVVEQPVYDGNLTEITPSEVKTYDGQINIGNDGKRPTEETEETTKGGPEAARIDAAVSPEPDEETSKRTLKGILYVFEEDLTKPIPLHDTVLRFIIRSVDGFKGDWSTLVDVLNHTYAKQGSIVYVNDLKIAVIFNGKDWEYFSGVYTIPNEKAWDKVPKQFKIPNRVVHCTDNDSKKIIQSDKTLSEEVLKVNSPPESDKLEPWRYYDVNGYLYYSIGDTLYALGDKTTIFCNTNLKVGDNKFKHQFNSKYVEAHCLINNGPETTSTFYNNCEFPIQTKFIDENTINIVSSIAVNKCFIIFNSKTSEKAFPFDKSVGKKEEKDAAEPSA